MDKATKIVWQVCGLGMLIVCLSGLRSLPSKQVRSDLSLCEAADVTVPTTITTNGLISSYELSGVNSYLVLTSLDGCTLKVSASQDVIGKALVHVGKQDAYVKVSGEVKGGMITPKVGGQFSISEVVRRCGVEVYGDWESSGIGDGIVGYTRTTLNSYPTPISIKPEIRESIPQDNVWHVGCTETTNGIRQVVSVARD